MFTWFLVTWRSFSIVVQSSLGLDKSSMRTTANDLWKRHYFVKSVAHETMNIFIYNHTCSTNGERNHCENTNAKIELNVPTKGDGSFKATLSSEETFPLSLVQNCYFGHFPPEVLGDCIYKTLFLETFFQSSKIQNILTPFSSLFLCDWVLLLPRVPDIS